MLLKVKREKKLLQAHNVVLGGGSESGLTMALNL